MKPEARLDGGSTTLRIIMLWSAPRRVLGLSFAPGLTSWVAAMESEGVEIEDVTDTPEAEQAPDLSFIRVPRHVPTCK